MSEQVTIEEALTELREIFPTGYVEIAQGIGKNNQRYFEFRGSSKERWTPQRADETLSGLMAQIRSWKESQK